MYIKRAAGLGYLRITQNKIKWREFEEAEEEIEGRSYK